jgi:hypothetical protein
LNDYLAHFHLIYVVLGIDIRISVSTALDHPYLITGYLPDHKPDSSSSLPIYATRNLYDTHIRPPRWSTDDSLLGGQAGDSRWARRQFSTLWAPMPPAYAVDESTSGPSLAANLLHAGHLKANDPIDLNIELPFSVLRSALPIVIEQSTESLQPFILKPSSNNNSIQQNLKHSYRK